MTRLRRLAATAVVLAAVPAAAFLQGDVSLPGHRGARRLVTGFVPGRWDARFVVARGPAAVHLPPLPLRVTLTLSGPARVEATTAAGSATRVFGDAPEPWTFDLAGGGVIALQGDATMRLHGLRLVRTGGPSAAFAWIAARAGWDRVLPMAVLFAAMTALLVAAATMRHRTTVVVPWRRPAIFASIVLASCLIHVLFWPQPLIIGDPGAYYDMAARFRDALRSPWSLGESLHVLRPYAGLAFTATVYGALRALRDAPSTIYAAQALAMGAAVFFLVRAAMRIDRRLAATVGVLAALYATFPVICGIVQPEPFILLAWCFAFDRVAAADDEDEPRRLVPAGLAFGLGLALHPQGIWYLLAAAVLVLAPFALVMRRPTVRRRVAAFAVGLLPVVLATSIGEGYARPAVHVLEERYGFFAYTVPHPLGFWLFLESDGWQSAVRLDETRYGSTFAAAREAGQIRGGADAWKLTIRFVASEWKASLRAVLRNLHRLYRRPDNPFHRTWLIPYGLQVAWHQALVVAFLLSVPLLLRSRAWAAVLPVAMLAATYPLYHIFNKYAVPATPFLLLGAALGWRRLAESRPRVLTVGLAAAAIGTWIAPATVAFAGVPVPLARWGLLALQMVGLATAFVAASRWADGAFGRAAAAVAGIACLVALAGSAWDDPSWRAFRTSAAQAPRQEIVLDERAMSMVSHARESYLALDLQVDDGDARDLRLVFDSGLEIPGASLVPTMPSFGLATVRGGRDPRGFPQWWIVRWRPEMSPNGRLAVTVHGDPGSTLAGDIGPDPPGTHHGLSLGHWPHVSVYRLMHEGEYRLPVHQPVDPSRRTSGMSGRPSVPGTYGVRLVALDDDAGGAAWITAPVPAGDVVTAIWARAGRAAPAEMQTPSGPVAFEMGGPGPWSGAGGELRYVPTGEYEGWYFLRTRAASPGPLTLGVRPLQQMSSVPKYFLPDLRNAPPVPPEWSSAPFGPAAEIIAAREAPAWRPIGVY